MPVVASRSKMTRSGPKPRASFKLSLTVADFVAPCHRMAGERSNKRFLDGCYAASSKLDRLLDAGRYMAGPVGGKPEREDETSHPCAAVEETVR